MQAGRLSRARWQRHLLAPLAAALPPLFWVVDATRRASFTTLGRDQGIFQYVAWAIGRGAVDYRDVRDVNGPLTHLIHLVFLSLGGDDEHRFRCLDLATTGVSYAFVGACLPGLRGDRRAAHRKGPSLVERAGWAAAAWVVLSSQYLLYGWWDSAQRESFFDWFVLPSFALLLAAQPRADRRGGAAAIAVAGALAAIPWFGKPTYALFTIAELAVLVLDPETPLSRWRRILAFAGGGLAGAAIPITFLVGWCDVAAYARIQFVDVPAMYRFIWPRSAADVLSTPFYATHAILAVAGAMTIGALALVRELPVRALGVALFPLCALGSVLLQSKGFPYHFHPVTAGVYLQWLLLLVWLAERTRVATRRWALVRLVPVLAGVAVAVHAATALEDSPNVRDTWLLWAAAGNPQAREREEYFEHFDRSDFFPAEMRKTADYLRARTTERDRIQVYGMDAYVLFLAGRLSATPYLYAYDLDVDTALSGGTAGRPSAAQMSRIRAMRAEHEADLLSRVSAAPPAAFVFFDGAPLLSSTSAWDDFEGHCPETAAWVQAHYRETALFGHDHVWLRNDLPP
jgi:hypothetical protein